MKTLRMTPRLHGLALLLLVITAAAALGQSRFAITKSTTDSGGNSSADVPDIKGQPPRFTLTGTIGQPDASAELVSSSSRFAVHPGFWGEYGVIQLPEGPPLTIRKGASGFVVLAWPVAVEGFILTQSPDLTQDSWTNVLIPVVDTATEHTVTVPITQTRLFFRLKKP